MMRPIMLILASWLVAQCSAFLPSPVLSTSATIPAGQGRVSRSRTQTLQMATGMDERKEKMKEKARSQMSRRAMLRAKKTYRSPITYPRMFTPRLREAQKNLVDSPEMGSYMKSLVERGYMVEIKGKVVSLGSEDSAPASMAAPFNDDADE